MCAWSIQPKTDHLQNKYVNGSRDPLARLAPSASLLSSIIRRAPHSLFVDWAQKTMHLSICLYSFIAAPLSTERVPGSEDLL